MTQSDKTALKVLGLWLGLSVLTGLIIYGCKPNSILEYQLKKEREAKEALANTSPSSKKNVPIVIVLRANVPEEQVKSNGFTGAIDVKFYSELGKEYLLYGRPNTMFGYRELGKFVGPAVTTNGIFTLDIQQPLKEFEVVVIEKE